MPGDLFGKPSLVTRTMVGKGVGLLIGGVCYLSLPLPWPEAGPLLRWGVLLWHTTLGGLIGVFGVFNHHPVLQIPMPWWVRAPFMGAWMNFVLCFFAYDRLAEGMLAITGMPLSPFWIVAEGSLVGLLIGGCATWAGGEGRAAADVMDE